MWEANISLSAVYAVILFWGVKKECLSVMCQEKIAFKGRQNQCEWKLPFRKHIYCDEKTDRGKSRTTVMLLVGDESWNHAGIWSATVRTNLKIKQLSVTSLFAQLPEKHLIVNVVASMYLFSPSPLTTYFKFNFEMLYILFAVQVDINENRA